MILWYIDRFGLPGRYYTTWLTLLHQSGIPTQKVIAVSLHSLAKCTLLQRYASRKAPTWIPDEAGRITSLMATMNQRYKPEAIVLSSPESLVVTGVHPEHATLHKLRGSVYWIDSVPHIVILPMSTFFTMVNQKDIGAANYGFESAETLTASVATAQIEEVAEVDSDPSVDHNGNDDSPSGESDSHVEDLGDAIEGINPRDRIDKEDEVEDAFFYEPVLSPVGRFTITADIGKLKRILDKREESNGPSSPIQLRYR